MGKAIGIDLGTTNTAVAVLVDGRPRVIEDDKGYKVLPSCVSMRDGGDSVVGHAAKNLALTQPDRTVQSVKRLVGRRFDSPEVDRIRRRVVGIQPASDGGCVSMADKTWTPIEVSARVLQHAKEIAERALGEEVDEAVITVPAYFNHQRRAATYEAARIASLRCDACSTSPPRRRWPTASGRPQPDHPHLRPGRRDLRRVGPPTDQGGLRGALHDWRDLPRGRGLRPPPRGPPRRVLPGQARVDLRADRDALQRLKDAAERAKCELSFTDRTTVLVPRITANQNLELAVTRHKLEGLVEDLVEQTLGITRNAVSEAGLSISDIDDVILVGGQTRMPRVREAISALFGKEPSRSVHPEEVVAIGAAVHAHSLVEPEAAKPLLLDVTPFDLGIDVAGGLFQPIITRNSHVPASASRTFATAHDNQDNVQVTVRQGESRFATENEFLGRFVNRADPGAAHDDEGGGHLPTRQQRDALRHGAGHRRADADHHPQLRGGGPERWLGRADHRGGSGGRRGPDGRGGLEQRFGRCAREGRQGRGEEGQGRAALPALWPKGRRGDAGRRQARLAAAAAAAAAAEADAQDADGSEAEVEAEPLDLGADALAPLDRASSPSARRRGPRGPGSDDPVEDAADAASDEPEPLDERLQGLSGGDLVLLDEGVEPIVAPPMTATPSMRATIPSPKIPSQGATELDDPFASSFDGGGDDPADPSRTPSTMPSARPRSMSRPVAAAVDDGLPSRWPMTTAGGRAGGGRFGAGGRPPAEKRKKKRKPAKLKLACLRRTPWWRSTARTFVAGAASSGRTSR